MDKQTTIDYTTLPFTGHTGVTLNDHLRGRLGQIPRIPDLVSQKAAAAEQKQQIAAKHEQEKQDLQSARDQIAQIAAARQQAVSEQVAAQIPESPIEQAVGGLRQFFGK